MTLNRGVPNLSECNYSFRIDSGLHGVKVKILALSDLIQMKTRSGRPQDLEDVAALKLIQKNEKS